MAARRLSRELITIARDFNRGDLIVIPAWAGMA